MLRPVDDKIIVELEKSQEQTTSSGFILTSIEEKPNTGVVVAVGPGLMLDNGVLMKPDLEVGDKVMFAKFAGTDYSEDGKDYIILPYRDILVVLG